MIYLVKFSITKQTFRFSVNGSNLIHNIMIQNRLLVYRLTLLSTVFGALNCGPTSINNAVDSCRWSGQPLQSTFACNYLAQRLHAASKTILREMAKINRLLLLACHKIVTLDFTSFNTCAMYSYMLWMCF